MTTEPPADGQDGAPDVPDIVELVNEKAALEHEVEALRHEVDAKGKKKRRGRTIGAWVLLVLACLLAITSVVVVYARNQLLNTDTFVATLAPLASDPAVQTAVATKVSNSLVEQTNLEQRVKDALPARADFLANPITSTVKTASYTITLKLVQSSQFQKLWEQALRQSHEQLDNLLLGQKVGALNAANGQVTVNLSKVEDKAKQVLAQHGLSVFNKVPQYNGAPYVLFQSKQLLKLQRWVKFLNSLALVLPIVSLLLFAVSVLLARDRRRGLVHAASGLAVSMAVLLIGANVGRNQYLASLLPGQSKNATAAVIDTVDASLLDSVRTLLILAAVVALIAFVAGLAPVRRWWSNRTVPSWLTTGPVHDVVAAHRRAFQWLVLGVGLVVLVVWNQPTVKVALIVLLITFLVVIIVGVYGRTTTASVTTPPEDGPPSDSEVPTGAAVS